MSEQISFIHAADLHLDSPFLGLSHVPESVFNEVQESTFIALERLVTTAINKKVDFVLLVGDLFDNEKQSLKAQVKLREAFEQLRDHHILVYLSYGNHDFINGNIHPVTYPENVFIFESEEVNQFIYEKNGKPIATIYGFSYENRAVTNNKVDEFHRIDNESIFHIGMLHGSIQGNNEHDRYAPFQINDLHDKSFDYWALGHIHRRQILNKENRIVYPGNIQGRHRNERGKKGCYHVTLSRNKSKLDFVPLQALTFETMSVDVSDCKDIYQLENKLRTNLQKQINKHSPQLVDLTLKSSESILIKWKNEGLIDEMIQLMNESMGFERYWQYIYRISTNVHKSKEQLVSGNHFFSELLQKFKEVDVQPNLASLFHHRQGRKYLQVLSESEQEEIKREAEQLLINELIEGD